MNSSRKLISKGSSGSLGVVISRITGLIRDMLIARALGGGSVMSAWVLAFRIPNTFRGLLGEGAATQALIPLFGNIIHFDGKEKLRKDLGVMLGTLAVLLGIICVVVSIVCIILMPYFPVYRINAALALMPILMPYTFFVCLTSICSSVLNLFDKYFLPMLTSALLNIAIIVAILIFYYQTPEILLVKISWATLISGVLQLIWLLFLLKKEDALPHSFRPGTFKTPIVKEFFTLATPRFFGAAAVQVSSLMDSCMALYISAVAAPALYFSERIVYLPIGIFAVSLGNVCLVTMTKHIAENKIELVIQDLRYGLRQILYVSVPMTLVFVFYRYPLLKIIYGGDRFSSLYVQEAAWAMLFYCFGIPSFCAMKVIASAFYSQKDTKTPVKVALWCIVINFFISFALMFPLKQGGIALGTVISSILNCVILTYIFKKRHNIFDKNKDVIFTLVRTTFASLVAIGVSFIAEHYVVKIRIIETINWKGSVSFVFALCVFCLIYGLINYLLKSEEQRDWLHLGGSKLGFKI